MRKNDLAIDPGDYKEIGKLVMTKELAIKWTALMIPTLIVFISLTGLLFAVFTGKNEFGVTYNASHNYVQNILQLSFLAISTIIFHEFIHGAFMSKYGGKPRYGMGIAHWIVPFAYATTDATFRRNQYIAIAISPLFVITFAGIFFIAASPDFNHWMVIPLAFNSAGAVGDLWMTFLLLRMPEHVLVKDNITGLTFYGKPSDEQPDISSGGLILDFVKGFTIGLTISILLNSIYQSEITGFFGLSLSFPPLLLPVSVAAGLIYAVIKYIKKQKKE
ncbi:Putative zincin peptidase [uncultured archaeon]|nr:Putative zincin peptidase [uncultured archaeon]